MARNIWTSGSNERLSINGHGGAEGWNASGKAPVFPTIVTRRDIPSTSTRASEVWRADKEERYFVLAWRDVASTRLKGKATGEMPVLLLVEKI